MKPIKIAIVGAGLIGRLLAYYLVTSTKHKVTIFDNQQPSAADCAAGMIAPYTELDRAESWLLTAGLQSLDLWPKILANLPQSVFFAHKGSIVTAHPQDYALLDFYLSKITEKSNYSPPSHTMFNRSYYFSNEAHIDAQALLSSLKDFLVTKLNWMDAEVGNVTPGKVSYYEKNADFDLVIDCRGMGAKNTFPELRAVRGEVLWLQAEKIDFPCPVRLLHPRYSIYLAPRPNGIFILGATEIETEDFSPISVRSTLELLSAAQSLDARFLEARIIASKSGCRPTLPSHLPAIKMAEGLMAINGFYRHGFLLAPAVLQDVMHYLRGDKASVQFQQLWEYDNDHSALQRPKDHARITA